MKDYINDMRAYFREGQCTVLKKGQRIEVFHKENEQVNYISSGYVRIYVINPRGEQYTHIIYGPGDMYPVSWMYSNDYSPVLGEALTETEIFTVPADKLAADVEASNELACGILQQTVDQYRVYSSRVFNLEYKYASERLAFRILSLAQHFGERSGDVVTIIPPLTHHMLGSSINLSRESVSREMEKLLRKELVRYNSARQIVVPDMQALAKHLQLATHEA